jgi:hypothetical protein
MSASRTPMGVGRAPRRWLLTVHLGAGIPGRGSCPDSQPYLRGAIGKPGQGFGRECRERCRITASVFPQRAVQ